MTVVLVCDDEPHILRALRLILRKAGYDVLTATSVTEALDQAVLRAPDAAILDLVLPDGDGVEITKSLREWASFPIIVLSAVGEETEKVRALQAGADDYVTKPFGSQELIARLEAILRRSSDVSGEPVVRLGEVEFDLTARIVRRAGVRVRLTPKEFELFRMLVKHRGRLMTHQMLLSEVWGPRWSDDVGTLRTHMSNLRRKLQPHGSEALIETDPGIGYRLVA